MTGNGYNEEEMKMVKETRKIWGTDDVAVTATCIRVPVMRAHAEAIHLEFAQDITADEARGEEVGQGRAGSVRVVTQAVG